MGIDLNVVDEAPPPPPAVCRELWHACTGPVVALPRRGSLVVYLPQGHLAAAGARGGDVAVDLPPHVVCSVADVELCADAATDEVYARLALVAEAEAFERNLHGGGPEGEGDMAEDGDAGSKSRMLHMFCKTLTASDTSTHGGFSVPRRAAEDCFAPLDYNQLRPSQELVAKDLHGAKWKFRHIYRGQPRRHLITTGWSSFVNRKKLVSGDAVLFLRGDDGELRLGVRRAIQHKNETLFKDFSSDNSKCHTLSAVAYSLKHRSVFHISYNPRATGSEYIIPYRKFLKSLNHPVCTGTRINFHCENEDVNKRQSGIIVGISEVDSMKWPGSKWKSLVVRWEDGTDCNNQSRVSPWEIEIVGGSVPAAHPLPLSSSKRTKLCPQGNLDAPTMWNGCTDSMETGKLPRVLQGQELMGFRTHHRVSYAPQTAEVAPFESSNARRFATNVRGCMLSCPTSRLAMQNSGFTYQSVGFSESIRFSEVLQGQEISQPIPLFQGMMSEACSMKGRYGRHGVMRTSATVDGLSSVAQEFSLTLSTSPAAQVPSSYPEHIYNQTVVSELGLASKADGGEGASGSQPNDMLWEIHTRSPNETAGHVSLKQLETRRTSAPGDAAKLGAGGRELRKTSCRLFGFSLTEKIRPADDDGVNDGNYETERQNPRMLDLFGYNCSTSGPGLPALCAAPLGM